MSAVQKMAMSGLITLSIILVLGACAPDLDDAAPTEAIQVINIPAVIVNTATDTAKQAYYDYYNADRLNRSDYLGYLKEEDYSGPRPAYKIFVQLSAGMTASAGYAAKGDAEITPGASTVTITNLKGPDGLPFKSANWAFESLTISPRDVDSIFDIEVRVGTIGPSLSPTVVFDWNNMSSKKLMKMDDYKNLYESDNPDWGPVEKDDTIIKSENAPVPSSPSLNWSFFK